MPDSTIQQSLISLAFFVNFSLFLDGFFKMSSKLRVGNEETDLEKSTKQNHNNHNDCCRYVNRVFHGQNDTGHEERSSKS